MSFLLAVTTMAFARSRFRMFGRESVSVRSSPVLFPSVQGRAVVGGLVLAARGKDWTMNSDSRFFRRTEHLARKCNCLKQLPSVRVCSKGIGRGVTVAFC